MFLWLLARAKQPDGARRVLIAHIATYIIVTLACAYGLPHQGPPSILPQAQANIAPSLAWLAIDMLRMMRRRAKMRDAYYIAQMR